MYDDYFDSSEDEFTGYADAVSRSSYSSYESIEQARHGSSQSSQEEEETWKTIQEFTNEIEFNDWYENKKTQWKKNRLREYDYADVQHFVCAFSKRCKKGYSCLSELKVVYYNESRKVDVQSNGVNHNDKPGIGANALSQEVKEIIISGIRNKRTATQVQDEISAKRIRPIPTIKQIQNSISRAKKNIFGPQIFTINDLENYANQKSQEPAEFGAHCDCYLYAKIKSSYNDADKHFLPTAVCLSSHEDAACYELFLKAHKHRHIEPSILLGDGSQAITKAVKAVYPHCKRTMCWSHACTAMEDRLKAINDNVISEQIRKDIDLLQTALSEDQFKKMAHLCHEYWINTYEMESVTTFAKYFISTWVNSDLCNWFETASDFASTNNGLECLNRVIKDTRTLRKKMPLNEFTANVEQMLTDWSNKPEYQNPKRLRSILDEHFQLANDLHNENRGRLKVNEDHYVMSAKSIQNANRNNAYINICCQVGIKKSICKHSIFTMVTIKELQIPNNFQYRKLETRRRRGRPKKVGTALVRDD
uniref:MULE transposase domain-containing protein n=1 Tax=Acrobeloides nanus TaxID=290746 RepID=A0A914CLN7_9BILA